jgi:hypothetical protein
MHAVERPHGFSAGNARIAVLPAATGAKLGAFLKANIGQIASADRWVCRLSRPRRVELELDQLQAVEPARLWPGLT